MGFELVLKLLDSKSEGIQFLFNLDSLITDNVDNVLFYFIHLLLSLVKSPFRRLDSLDWLFLSFLADLDTVLLQFQNHVSHPVDHCRDLGFYCLHLTDVLHDFHQQVSILLFLPFCWVLCLFEHSLWVHFQSIIGLFVEIFEVFQSGLKLVGQEVSVNFNPAVNFHLERFDEVP